MCLLGAYMLVSVSPWHQCLVSASAYEKTNLPRWAHSLTSPKWQKPLLVRMGGTQIIFPGTLSDSFAENRRFSEPTVESVVQVADLRKSWRSNSWIWRTWHAVVVCGCEAGWINCQIIALHYSGDDLILEQTFNRQLFWSTFLQSAIWLHAPSKLDTSAALCCDNTAYFRGAFCCDHSIAHLWNDHAVLSASWHATPLRWMDYLGAH